MSGDPKDPRFNPQAGEPTQRPGERGDERAAGDVPGFRPPSLPTGARPENPARPSPPWDLTTRVPAAVQRHVSGEDLTLLAMQLLSPEEAASITQHVEHCAECRRELAQIRSDLGIYAFTVPMHEPSASARENLMRKISREKKPIPISHSRSAANIATFGRTSSILVSDDEEVVRSSRAPAVLAWTGWAVAAGLAVTAGLGYRDRIGLRASLQSQAAQITHLASEASQSRRLMDAIIDPHAQRVTLTTKPLPPSPVGRATYNADRGTLVFLASDLEPLQPDKTYELWLIPTDGSNPLPAGLFHPDDAGNASVIMPTLPKGVQAKGFGVTIENEGGAETPTKPIIMAGF